MVDRGYSYSPDDETLDKCQWKVTCQGEISFQGNPLDGRLTEYIRGETGYVSSTLWSTDVGFFIELEIFSTL